MIFLKVDPEMAKPGDPQWVWAVGGTTVFFHSKAELAVWLDGAYAAGMQPAEKPVFTREYLCQPPEPSHE